jgi:hypothetical protein
VRLESVAEAGMSHRACSRLPATGAARLSGELIEVPDSLPIQVTERIGLIP